ncbi:MAG TPA: hypothetical protein PK114_09530, partial [Smithellaceae bacterium]|nr:hypothetical protein [Smithellaceae bacterium]
MRQKQEKVNWLYRISHAVNCTGMGIIFLLMILTVAVFFSLAEGELKGRNVKIDLLVSKIALKNRSIIDAIVKSLGFVFYCFVTYAVF